MRSFLSSEFNTFYAVDEIYRFEIRPTPLHVFDIIYDKKLTLLSVDILSCLQILRH
jgi:hypothetical protein